MRQIITLAFIASTLCFTACAQKLDASKVPQAVKTSFQKHFPGTTAKWEKEGDKYEAGFKQNGTGMSAVFEANGIMTESETGMPAKDLPANILAYVKTNYPGKSVKEAAKISSADGTITYEAEVNGKDLIFDASGKYLKTVKD